MLHISYLQDAFEQLQKPEKHPPVAHPAWCLAAKASLIVRSFLEAYRETNFLEVENLQS
jgi:hypothetical protein